MIFLSQDPQLDHIPRSPFAMSGNIHRSGALGLWMFWGAIILHPARSLNLPHLYCLICDMGLVIWYLLHKTVVRIKLNLVFLKCPEGELTPGKNSEVCFLFLSAHLNKLLEFAPLALDPLGEWFSNFIDHDS